MRVPLFLSLCLAFAVESQAESKRASATMAEDLATLDGFKVELLASADAKT